MVKYGTFSCGGRGYKPGQGLQDSLTLARKITQQGQGGGINHVIAYKTVLWQGR